MTKDRIVDEYLNGNLPFSAIYRKASEGEKCPDELSAAIRARAARWNRLWPAVRAVRRLRREVLSRFEQHPLLVGVTLPMAVVAALFVALNFPAGNIAKTGPVLECPGPSDAGGTGAGQTTRTRAPEPWLEQIRRLRQQGRIDEADAALAEFRRAYPDYPLRGFRAGPD
jgi:hypothetical protein